MRRPLHLLATLALAATIVPSAQPVSGAAVRAASVTGWVPYWQTTTGIRSLNAAADVGLMTEVMPFFFSATGATTIAVSGSTPGANVKAVVDAARARSQRVIPSITDGTGKLAMQAVLLDPVTRTAHIDTLVNLVVNGYDFAGTVHDGISFDGIDLDYEGFAFTDGRPSWAATQPAWLAFVKELGDRLHAQGKLLSITIPPMWGDPARDYWVYGPWAPITAAADRLRLMVYDWSVAAPGPIAPMSWVRKVLAEVQRQVPVSELGEVWLGVPQHGRSWARRTGECPDVLPSGVTLATSSVTAVNAPGIASARGAVVTETTDAAGNPEGEKTFSWSVGSFTGPKTEGALPPAAYEPPPVVANEMRATADGSGLAPAVRIRPTTTRQVTCSIQRVVHYPDTASVVQRANAAQAAGLAGIVIWALGYEPLELWPALAAG